MQMVLDIHGMLNRFSLKGAVFSIYLFLTYLQPHSAEEVSLKILHDNFLRLGHERYPYTFGDYVLQYHNIRSVASYTPSAAEVSSSLLFGTSSHYPKPQVMNV